MKIIYEDNNLLIIDKPAGISVHSGAGKEKSTIVDWFLGYLPKTKRMNWPDLTRPGIVHRLDKDTSGLLLLAKKPQTLEIFQNKFQNHEIQKTYLALVLGPVKPEKGEIITKISRSNRDFRLKKTSIFNMDESAKTAISYYDVVKILNHKPACRQGRSEILNLLSVRIMTGRTHQIRTQMKYKGWPILGDQQYNTKISRRISDKLNLHRQFLHAYKLEFCYNGKKIGFVSELPEELNNIILNPKFK